MLRGPPRLHHVAGARMLRLHVWSITQILHEIANGTSNLLSFVERERYDGEETNGDPLPRRDAMRGPIPTVVALRRHALVAF